MHPGIWWLLGILAWIPAGYGLTLILKDWLAVRRKERAVRPLQPCSVTEIAARIERECAEEAAAEPEIRWPKIDRDGGQVSDARPTVPITNAAQTNHGAGAAPIARRLPSTSSPG